MVRADSQRTDGKRLADRPDGKQGATGAEHRRTPAAALKRSTVKQPVMTVVYGVTDYGATDQIYAQLEGDSEDANDESKYLVKIVMDSIGDVPSLPAPSWRGCLLPVPPPRLVTTSNGDTNRLPVHSGLSLELRKPHREHRVRETAGGKQRPRTQDWQADLRVPAQLHPRGRRCTC